MSRTMKDSGVEWINIPLKHIVACNQQVLSEQTSIGNTFFYIDISSVNDTGEISNLEQFSFKDAPSRARRIVKNGDVIISTVRTYLKAIALINETNEMAICSTGFAVLSPSEKIRSEFLYYAIYSNSFTDQVVAFSTGISYPAISSEKLMQLRISLPPIKIQDSLITYLYEMCSKIDRLIALQEEMITQLQAYKQSVITEAVTKGLDPDAPMKDSGEGITEIPENWDLMRLKFGTKIRNEKANGLGLEYIGLENIESLSGKLILTDSKYDTEQALLAHEGDVLFGKLRPYLVKVYQVPQTVACSGEFAVFYNFRYSQTYLRYQLLSNWFISIVDASTYGTKMPRANVDYIKNMIFVFPPADKQKEIAEFLDQKCQIIDNMISLKQSKIERLKEYKKSLIYECVTGKRDCNEGRQRHDA